MEEVLEEVLSKEFEKYIYVLKHEIKNPVLAQIQGLKYLLKSVNSDFSPLQKEILELTLNSCYKQCSIINDLISTFKFKKNDVKVRFENVLLIDCLNKVVNQLILELNLPAEIFEMKVDWDENFIKADKVQLYKALKMLLLLCLERADSSEKINIFLFNDCEEFVTIEVEGILSSELCYKTDKMDLGFNQYCPIGTLVQQDLFYEIIKYLGGAFFEKMSGEKFKMGVVLKI